MHLSNFENYIEDKIVDRGRDYYHSDSIESIEQVDKGEFSAIVWGTDEYEVYVKLDKNGNITGHDCDCPYDWGNVCKHEVAVFLHIRNHQLHWSNKTQMSQIQLALNNMSDRKLRAFVLEKLKRDRGFREDFMGEFG